MPKKIRIDLLLVDRQFFPSRTDAQKAILAGFVKASSQLVHKSNELFDPEVPIEILAKRRYVSRGGEKLGGALESFSISVAGKTCLDVGASHGGFTDCLLQHGAEKVYAADVGYGQLDVSLRQNPKVIVLEKVNARYFKATDFPEKMDLATVDVSFISLEKILPALIPLLKEEGVVLALVKPQFEVGKGRVGKGGVVRSEKDRLEAVEKVKNFGMALGLKYLGTETSTLKGPAGNVEYFIYFRIFM
ncbi:MAG: TlyA family RNA methyltransferase [Chlamydiae bacterium]|nr:TlyA family RNA methyltransferase [Chlamydiota bacterium]MBI3265706.1 TlyA family RNA methyltransferase [Chlamydiota bacterium]